MLERIDTPMSGRILEESFLDRLVKTLQRRRQLSKTEIMSLFGLSEANYPQVCSLAANVCRHVRRVQGRHGGLIWVDRQPSYPHLVRDLVLGVAEESPHDFSMAQAKLGQKPAHAPAVEPDSQAEALSVEELYDQCFLSIGRITQLKELGYWEVVEVLDDAGISIRHGGRDLLDEDHLHHAFHVLGQSFSKIAEDLEVEPKEVRDRMLEARIPLQRRRELSRAA